MIKMLLFIGFVFLVSKFIPKFFKDYKFHRSIVKYFDFLFIANLPYFFVLLVIFCWGMSLAYYSNNTDGYFFTSLNYKEIIFFFGFMLFMFGINIKTRLDNLSILDGWSNNESQYKKNLNHLYPSPNFVSPELALNFSKTYSLIGSALILFFDPLCFLLLFIYYISNFYLNKKTVRIFNVNNFMVKSFFNLLMLFVLFCSGWVHFGGGNVMLLVYYFPLFLLANLPIILIYEIILCESLGSEEIQNRYFVMNNKKMISLMALFMIIALFFLSFFLFNDPITSHFSIITAPFLVYAFFRSENKDFIRSFAYPIMAINILLSWTIFPFLFIAQLIIYYLSKYYFWHRFETHFPTFLVDSSE